MRRIVASIRRSPRERAISLPDGLPESRQPQGSRRMVVRRTHDDAGGIPYAVTGCMRTTTCSALMLCIGFLAAAPVSSLAATPEHAVLRVHIETRVDMLTGAATLTCGPTSARR